MYILLVMRKYIKKKVTAIVYNGIPYGNTRPIKLIIKRVETVFSTENTINLSLIINIPSQYPILYFYVRKSSFYL